MQNQKLSNSSTSFASELHFNYQHPICSDYSQAQQLFSPQKSNSIYRQLVEDDKSPSRQFFYQSHTSNLYKSQKQVKRICFKIVVIGQSFVGKTSLIQKFTNPNPKKNLNEYNTTVGVDFSSKSIQIDDSIVQLQIWDTCGHDIYRSMTTSFYRGACGVYLVFALNDKKSFEKIQFWYDEFQESGSPLALVAIIGTKSDLPREIERSQALEMMKKLGGIFYAETSAGNGQQIQQLFLKTAELMYKKYKISHQFRVLAEPRKHIKSSILISDLSESRVKKDSKEMKGRTAYSEGAKQTETNNFNGTKRKCC